jgi:hypothetical protein
MLEGSKEIYPIHAKTIHTSCDGTETLLTGCIPNLKLDTLSIQFNGTDFEIDANSSDK